MRTIYILFPERRNFADPFIHSANLLGKLSLELQMESVKLMPVSWKRAQTDPSLRERIQVAIVPTSSIYKVVSKKSKNKEVRRFLAETTNSIASWDLASLSNLKLIIVVRWTDSLNMLNSRGSSRSQIISLDPLKDLGIKISYFELENDKSVFETLFYYICSISRANVKAKSLSHYLQPSSPSKCSTPGSSITVENFQNRVPTSIHSLVVLFIGLGSIPAQMFAEALHKLFSVQIMYHNHKQLDLPYKFEKDLHKALSCANTIILADDKFTNMKHWESIRSVSRLEEKKEYFLEGKHYLIDEKELELITPGSNIICTTKIKSINLSLLRNRIRLNMLNFVCLCLPIDCRDDDVAIAEEISLLDSVLVLPASSSHHCTPSDDLDKFTELIMKPIHELFDINNLRQMKGEYVFNDLSSTHKSTANKLKQIFTNKSNGADYNSYLTKIVEMFISIFDTITKERTDKSSRRSCSQLADSLRQVSEGRSSSTEHNIPDLESATMISLDGRDPWNLVKRELQRLSIAPLAESDPPSKPSQKGEPESMPTPPLEESDTSTFTSSSTSISTGTRTSHTNTLQCISYV